jgi:hypothetical protein
MIVEETQWWAERFIKAFNAEGTAEIVKERMSSRENWNPFPDTKVQASRGDFGADKAPNAAKKDGEDYSD